MSTAINNLLLKFILSLFVCFATFAKPTVTITSPITGTKYVGGQTFTLTGFGLDKNGNELPASAFEWYDLFYHNEHVHDGPAFEKDKKTVTFTISQTNEVDATVFYKFRLIVKDIDDQTDTAEVEIYPHKSLVTVTSNVAGIQYQQITSIHSTPYEKEGVENMLWSLFAPQEQNIDGVKYVFNGWGEKECGTGILLAVPQNDTLISLNYIKQSDIYLLKKDTIISRVENSIRTCIYSITTTSLLNKCSTKIEDSLLLSCSDSLLLNTNQDIAYSSNDLNLYPNPVLDILSIISSNKIIKQIKIYDLTGVDLITNNVGNYLLGEEYKFNVSLLPKGVYKIAIIYSDSSLIFKTIIIH